MQETINEAHGTQPFLDALRQAQRTREANARRMKTKISCSRLELLGLKSPGESPAAQRAAIHCLAKIAGAPVPWSVMECILYTYTLLLCSLTMLFYYVPGLIVTY